VRIPKSFNEFTVGQFIDWHNIIKSESDLIEREYKLLSMLLGITQEECENIPQGKLLPLFLQMNQYKESDINQKVKQILIVNHRPYIAICDAKHLKELLSTSQYTAFKQYTKEDSVQHMDKILALLYCPYRPFRKLKLTDKQHHLATIMRSAKIGDVFGAVFFYARLSEKLNPILQNYSTQAAKVIRERMEEIAQAHGVGLEKGMDGTM